MRASEFSEKTGWSHTKLHRAIAQGLFLGKTALGSGNYQTYTHRDMLMCQAIDWVRAICHGQYSEVLLLKVQEAIYSEEEVTGFLVVNPPTARFVDSAAQAAEWAGSEPESTYVFRFDKNGIGLAGD